MSRILLQEVLILHISLHLFNYNFLSYHYFTLYSPFTKTTKPLLDRGLSQDSIQEESEDEPLQFKGPMTRARRKRLEDQVYSRLLMLQAIGSSKDMKIWL